MLAKRKRALFRGWRCGTWLRVWVLIASVAFCVTAGAGGSAETTLVVVNAASPLSQAVANEYLRLRGVPETHLLRLSGIPSFGRLPINGFRRKIWQPIQDYLSKHGLETEIDLIAFSAGFPYAVDFASDVKTHKLPRNRYRGRAASLTGMTFFAHRVAAGDIGYLGKNHYFTEFAGPVRQVHRSSVAVSLLGKKEAKRLSKQAAAALRKKNYTEALKAYQQLIDSQPGVAEHWYNLARTEAAAGQTSQALETLTEAVDRGWVHSLRTRRDRNLAKLKAQPGFEDLIERMETAFGPFEITHGFRHRYVWSNSDLAFWESDDRLDQYYLSTLLAYTGLRGNSIPEIKAYLGRAAASDGTAPKGTVYLLENRDVRSETRQPLFPTAVSELARRGRKAEILRRDKRGQNGNLPIKRDDVIGAVVGSRRFDWKKSKSQLLPGAIAESLTSFGGHFDKASQTKLTNFLRHGAAGSSGAVAEPYSFQAKFPVPMLHAYYADGSSLAEAFYQSIQAPYQLIIVGDPLTRPFARFADIGLMAPDVGKDWSGVVTIEAALQPAEGTTLKTVELWIDGEHVSSAPVGEPLLWDTLTVEDGAHELRLVAVEDSPIETRSVFRSTLSVLNHNRRVTITGTPAEVGYAEAVEISGRAEGAEAVELRRGHELLAAGDVQDGHWRLSAPARQLGVGEAKVQVRAVFPDGQGVRSIPLIIRVSEPTRLPAVDIALPETPGLLARVRDAQGDTHKLQIKTLGGRIKALGRKGPRPVSIEFQGYLRVPQPGSYQLALRSRGQLRLWLHEQPLLDKRLSTNDPEAFVMLGLEAGWHPLKIELDPEGRSPSLKAVLAGQTAPALLSTANLGHHAALESAATISE